MSRTPNDGKVTCRSCGFANYSRAPFCVECSAPLEEPDEIDSSQSGRASRRRSRRSSEQPRSLVVVVGVWLLFGPIALYCLVTLLEGVPQVLREGLADREELFWSLFFMALMGLGLYLPFTIIRRVTLGYQQDQARRRRKKPIDDEDDDDETGGEFDDDFDGD